MSGSLWVVTYLMMPMSMLFSSIPNKDRGEGQVAQTLSRRWIGYWYPYDLMLKEDDKDAKENLFINADAVTRWILESHATLRDINVQVWGRWDDEPEEKVRRYDDINALKWLQGELAREETLASRFADDKG